MRSLREYESVDVGDDDMAGFAPSSMASGGGIFYREDPLPPRTSNVEFFMAAASASLAAQMSEGGGQVHATATRFPLSSPPAAVITVYKFTAAADEHARVGDVCKEYDRVEHSSGGAYHYLRTTPKVFAAAAAGSSGSTGGAGGSPHGLLGAAALINLSESSDVSI
jgi:hypothetical protein